MDTAWSALVIDDDPGVRQSLPLCLESDNARVLGVGTSAGALDALDRSRFDVVFLDLWLQSESGLAVLPEILRRASEPPKLTRPTACATMPRNHACAASFVCRRCQIIAWVNEGSGSGIPTITSPKRSKRGRATVSGSETT